uniref:Sushi domain-containing protein n=1 Tax=Gouania willdenowi TaxID=441366 RepID=A0A8C5I363_GOUWI
MRLIRLLVISLVLVVNTWLLKAVRSDAVSGYKRALGRRADRELSRLTGEPCTVSSVWRSRRQPRSIQSSQQQRPPAVRPRAHTTRGEQRLDERRAPPALCVEGCRFETGAQQGQKGHWGQTEGQGRGFVTSNTESLRDPYSSTGKGAQSASSSAHGLSRLRRSLGATFRYEDDSKSRLEKVSNSDNSSDLRPQVVLIDGNHQVDILEDYSGEELDDILTDAPGGGGSWSRAVPTAVPPAWMTALYFHGRREQLRLKLATGQELPRDSFSLHLWVKPEGGQSNPAIIAGVFDICSHSLSEKGWSVGIRTMNSAGIKDGRFYFTLRTDRAVKSTTVYSHQKYQANVWNHLMATYNGRTMTLYVDGAKVGESFLQSGNLHSLFMKTCRTFFLGSNQSDQGHSFRGHIGGVVLRRYASSQEDFLKPPIQTVKNEPIVEELWIPFKSGLHPTVITMPVPEQELVSPFLPPPCGLTTCDNTDIIFGYNNNWQLRKSKQIRYRIVNLANDDGGNPTVSQVQIQLQHRALTEAFRPYNITLDLSVHTVRKSSLRQKFILSNCRIGKIGNRHCDPECDHPRTGHDGGDCLRLGTCYNWKRQDGVCNMECNSIHYDYDDGDCCDPEVTDVLKTCFDPESPDRAYMSVKELKEELLLSGTDTLNVFFASNSMREELAGAATWPWAKEALTHQGGMVINPSYFGRMGHHNTMIHEMGHIFGLYHVFKGVSERDSCDDPCQETTASMETGDLCADTAPAPKSKACHDPGAVNDTCGVTTYQDTPYSNYMSYTDDNCTNHFTPNQVARMHCYLDLVYQRWLMNQQPAPIPMAPMVTKQSPASVSIYWLHPLSGQLYQSVNCGDCEKDGVFHQFAYEATSPRVCDTSGYWTPEEAIGPPDVEQPCDPSLQAWSPELSLYDTNVTSPCPETEGCTLTLRFLHPVVPHDLTLWVTYISASEYQPHRTHNKGKSITLGSQHVFCDMPLTIRLDTYNVPIEAIKLFTFDEKMEIDAAMLSSGPGSILCSDCRPRMYHVQRQPPFTSSWPPPQTQQTFTDSSVIQGVQYEYTVQVEAEGVLSDPSPPLLYTHGQSYCGDGLISRKEKCDDGNLLDGDGCSKKCHMEMGFKCKGEPSQCYVFDGDGVCEEFERSSSVQDCGYFTPLGYTDQWASIATASHQDPKRCPVSAVIGEPSLTKTSPADAWFPCTAQSDRDNDLEHSFWLKVGFVHSGVAASVMVYLASDGLWSGDQCRRTVTVFLTDTVGKNHSLGTHDLSCHRNPLVVNVTHDLSQPFFHTSSVILLFSTPSVAVGGVALRTSCHFSTFALTGCASEGGLSHKHPIRPAGECKNDRKQLLCKLPVDIPNSQTPQNFSYWSLFFFLQRKTELTCFRGSWDRVIRCQPVDCGFPDQSHVYHAIFSCPWGTTFGRQCSFTCGPPAILQGDSDRLVCLEDGLWSFPEAYCKIECPEVQNISNAKLLTHSLASGHNIGSISRYKCNPGHYVIGSPQNKTRRKYFRLECLEGGQWEENGCEPITCPALPDVFQGMYTCTNHLYYDTVCTLQCPDREIRCTKNGEWTADFTMCSRLQGPCSTPPDLNSVGYNCDEGTSVGNLCYPMCNMALDMDLYDPVVLPNGTTSHSLKHWMQATKVQIWTLTLVHVYGWCDTINNRAYCQYDGGDCCPSTLSSRKVIQFGADCNQDECTCRDPNAEENRGKAPHLEGGGGGNTQ